MLAELVKAAKAFKNGILTAEKGVSKAVDWLTANKSEIEGLSNLVFPGAGAIEDNAIALYDQIAGTVAGVEDAASANGLSITLDAATIASIKADIAAAKAFKA